MQPRARNWLTASFCLLAILLGIATLAGAKALVNITVTPDNNAAGAVAVYTISFSSTSYAITPTDSLIFEFPAGFDLSKVLVASSANGNMTGGLMTLTRNRQVILVRDGTGNIVPAGTPIAVNFGNVTNSTAAGNYLLSASIKDTAGIVQEGPASSSLFAIAPGAINNFRVTATNNGNIGAQTAGAPFNIKIVAQDQFNNVVTSFNGTANLSDATNTISPATTAAFVSGVLASQSVTITKAQASVTITAQASGRTGTSNAFTVNPGPAAAFRLANITSPQTAGIDFAISITALDAFGNTATGFAGTVDLQDPTGTISPATSGAFAAGVLNNQLVRITRAQSDITITASRSGNSGVSNLFNVRAGSLNRFAIAPISSPQVAGVPFEISMTAQDAFGNTVTSYAGTVAITPSAGSLTPSTSGNFMQGTRTQQVTISTVQSGATITVRDTPTGSEGTSNAFDVNAGGLARFAVTAANGGNIANQQAGVSFSIRIVAQDNGGNTVSSFNGTATLSDPTGTITPATTGAFVDGVLASQTVRIDRAQGGVTITARNGNSSGSSNSFDVTTGPLHHILIRTAANGGGIEFGNYSMTADDTVTVFAAGYDIGNVYVGDTSVNWSLINGLAGEQSGGTGTSFVFRPTTAPNSGRIRAVHATAGEDLTGTISVTPGAPANTLTLTATPATLPADGTSTATITSTTVLDADGNPVGSGREFTVRVIQTTAGTIPPNQDTNPSLPGVQIRTNASSQLSFQFRASTAGGRATITASSVRGTSYGETNINIGSIDVKRVVSPLRVSRGQLDARVEMTVENMSGAPFVLTDASLRFTGSGGVDRKADYPVITRADAITQIAPGATQTLLFDVDVSTIATVDTITIAGSVSGTIDGTSVTDNVVETPGGWRVQLPAVPRITVVTAPATVAQGQRNIPVSVKIENRSGFANVAPLLVDQVRLIFRNGATDVTAQYVQVARGTNPDTISGGGSGVFDFLVDATASADMGQITIDAQFNGRDINSKQAVNDNGADTPAIWEVTEGAGFQIVDIESPRSVTTGQTQVWQVKMVVQNNSSTNINIDIASAETFIRFFLNGVNRTSSFTLTKQPVLEGSGNTVLPGQSADRIVFSVTSTTEEPGDFIITGNVIGIDSQTGQTVRANTDEGGKGRVLVQTPASLRINRILVSQPTVTQGQEVDWYTMVALENNGGADIRIDFDNKETFIRFTDFDGYVIQRPSALLSGSAILRGGARDTLVYTIDRTGFNTGANLANTRVSGREVNRGIILSDSTNLTPSRQATFTVQTPANFFIDSTYVDAPNRPFVNMRNSIKLKVGLRNLGQEQVRNLSVRLETDGASRIVQNVQTLPALSEGELSFLEFTVVVDSLERQRENFTASFVSAISANTGGLLTPAPPEDNTTFITIQRPAKLNIVRVVPSQETVTAGQFDPSVWNVWVLVENAGQAALDFLPPPRASDINFEINGVPQTGLFIIDPLPNLRRSGTPRLAPGAVDTLDYLVRRTGPNGGMATIRANIFATDANDGIGQQVSDTGSVNISTKAAVNIGNTVVVRDGSELSVRNVNEQGNGLVNTQQTFAIRVSVENPSNEEVRDIGVSLRTNGNAQIAQPSQVISRIGLQSEDSLTFVITAPTLRNDIGELFTAVIDSATAAGSGTPARITAARDPTERVITQTPAQLQVEPGTVEPAGGKLTLGQVFSVFATVVNLGDATIDGSGRIEVMLPAGYSLVDTLTNPRRNAFSIGTPVRWNIRAPETPSGPDTVRFQIARAPLDRNVAQPAVLLVPVNSVLVETGAAALGVRSFRVIRPDGARDHVLSTGQNFTIEALLNVSQNLNNVQATLSLRGNYEFRIPNSATQNVVNDRVEWEIRAPGTATGVQDSIFVLAFGQTSANERVEARDTLEVTTIKRAELEFVAEIDNPPGANSGNLARNQRFRVRVLLKNNGIAQTRNFGVVELDVGDTGIIFANQTDSLYRNVSVGTPAFWELKAPDEIVAQKALRLRVTSAPLDENTSSGAEVDPTVIDIPVRTRESGRLTAGAIVISGPSGAQDSVVSSDQDNITLQASTTWQDARDIEAEILLPAGAGYRLLSGPLKKSATNTQTSGSETFQWDVIAPSQPRTSDVLRVRFTGRDAADTTGFSATTAPLVLRVVERARLSFSGRITAPSTAIDKNVSPDQLFTVQAAIFNDGDAAMVGDALIEIVLPEGYTTADTLRKRTVDGIAEWVLKAPPAPHDDPRNIDLRVLSTPRDENSGRSLELPEKESIPIRTVNNKLEVRQLQVRRGTSAVLTGQQNVEMFRFRLENTGENGANNILLQGLTLDIIDRAGTAIPAAQVLASIKVVKDNGQLLISSAEMGSGSQLDLDFVQADTLISQVPDTIRVLVDIAGATTLTNFRLLLNGVDHVSAVDQDSKKRVTVDLFDLANQRSNRLESLSAVPIENRFETSFYNAPNPFSPARDGVTRFTYTLQQSSEVELQIFTMFGELVLIRRFSASEWEGTADSGAGPKTIEWDGRNGKGQAVLNGVYLAVLRTAEGEATTKVAVLK